VDTQTFACHSTFSEKRRCFIVIAFNFAVEYAFRKAQPNADVNLLDQAYLPQEKHTMFSNL
jgi:hypothetical protein